MMWSDLESAHSRPDITPAAYEHSTNALRSGTPWAEPGTPAKTSAGGARVVYGRAATAEIDLATDTQGFRIDGASEGDRAGYSVASGDVNGDGRRDYILGAIGTACRNGGLPKVCEGDSGAAYVAF